MKVKDLIKHLEQFDPELDVVAYASCENYDVLTPGGITLEEGPYYFEEAANTREGLHIEIIGGSY